MKTILLFVSLAICLPLSAFATCTTDTPNNQILIDVLDKDGNPLNTSSRYFIIPAYYTMEGGGVRLANLGHQQQNDCPTSVVQSHFVTDDGIAVYFIPKNPKYQKIVVSTPVNIQFFLDYYLCANLTVWKVDNLGILGPPKTISTGAKSVNPLDVSSWFQIKPLNTKNIYKLVFCPHGQCLNVGFGGVPESGYYRLVLSEKPFPFKFKLDDRLGKAEA